MKCRNVYITLYGKLNDVEELDIVENKFVFRSCEINTSFNVYLS